MPPARSRCSFASVQMKKNRPGTLLTILARPEQREELSAIVFRETTTIGVRYHEVTRERLEREIVAVDTPLGTVRFKVARLGGHDRQRRAGVRRLLADCVRAPCAREGRAGGGDQGISGSRRDSGTRA